MADIGPEQQRLSDRLFSDPDRRILNFKFTPGEQATSKEELCHQINLALDEVESGQAKEIGPVRSSRPRVNVRELVENFK